MYKNALHVRHVRQLLLTTLCGFICGGCFSEPPPIQPFTENGGASQISMGGQAGGVAVANDLVEDFGVVDEPDAMPSKDAGPLDGSPRDDRDSALSRVDAAGDDPLSMDGRRDAGMENDGALPCTSVADGDIRRCDANAVGHCAHGMLRCVDDVLTCIAGSPTNEVCDAVDNDCDGLVDEGTHIPCGASAVGQCALGQLVCIDGQLTACKGAVDAIEEGCDGLDNDCDGRIDEGLNDCRCMPDVACFTGLRTRRNIGACADGLQRCEADGLFGACVDERLPADEACNNIDDDCDGQVDEMLQRPCGDVQGACEPGVSVCVDGAFQACSGGLAPLDELCDGRDNDCDGVIDEDLQRACGQSEGQCEAGTVDCVDGVWTVCRGEVGPILEACDGRDNDCDGVVDENLQQACGEAVDGCQAGIRTCVGGAWGDCDEASGVIAELCDGVDNDCDGRTDEDVSRTCGRATGECRRGTVVCEGGQIGACMGEVPPSEEICDGLDNDCDGSTDENVIQPCGVDVGACQRGVQRCEAGAFGSCIGAIEPVDERCDTIDNDCDGEIDESVSRPCGLDVGVCRSGTQGCQDGQFLECVGEVMAEAETCDGEDNDCDGRIDENVNEPCGDTEGVCMMGVRRCEAGVFGECVGQIEPSVDVCDALDNDCDGMIDEDTEQSCGRDVGVCQSGMRQCENGEYSACIGEVPATDEICDNLDNDCDGMADESLTQVCGSDIGACSFGQSVCEGGVFGACIGGATASDEICDGLDNDCDDRVDEDTTEMCGSDRGECAQGARTCQNGVYTACVGETPPSAESCDNLDNDCDGNVDELILPRPCPLNPTVTVPCVGGQFELELCVQLCPPNIICP